MSISTETAKENGSDEELKRFDAEQTTHTHRSGKGHCRRKSKQMQSDSVMWQTVGSVNIEIYSRKLWVLVFTAVGQIQVICSMKVLWKKWWSLHYTFKIPRQDFTVCSDNRPAWSKNWTIMVIWLQLVREKKYIAIIHCFLTNGHSYLPYDRDFALPEKYHRKCVPKLFVTGE